MEEILVLCGVLVWWIMFVVYMRNSYGVAEEEQEQVKCQRCGFFRSYRDGLCWKCLKDLDAERAE